MYGPTVETISVWSSVSVPFSEGSTGHAAVVEGTPLQLFQFCRSSFCVEASMPAVRRLSLLPMCPGKIARAEPPYE